MSDPLIQRHRFWRHIPSIHIGGYMWLLSALFVLLIIAPLLSSSTIFTLRLSSLLSLLVLLAGIFAVSRSRIAVWTLSILALCAVLFQLLHHFGMGDWLAVTANFFALFFLVGLFLIVEYGVFSDRQVTVETLAGACCGYVLMAAIFASIYSIILQFNPEGLSLWEGATITSSDIVFQGEQYGVLGYFSIATLTTLGYGDIVPNSQGTRSIASIEAILGQLYLAVIVARLVGMYITSRSMVSPDTQ